MADPRDGWSIFDVVAKAIAALLIPILLYVFADAEKERDDQRRRDDAREDRSLSQRQRQADYEERKADRASALVRQLASDSERERILALALADYLDTRRQLPEELWPVLLNVYRYDESKEVREKAGIVVEKTVARLLVEQSQQSEVVASTAKAAPKTANGASSKTEPSVGGLPPAIAGTTQASPAATSPTSSENPQPTSARDAPVDPKVAETAVQEAVEVSAEREGADPVLLWVDDEPENNKLFVELFNRLGIRVEVATSTDKALAALQKGAYDVVLSDMNRSGDEMAGVTLVKALRQNGSDVPFLVYTEEATGEKREQAIKSGAASVTDAPAEVLAFVTQAVKRQKPAG